MKKTLVVFLMYFIVMAGAASWHLVNTNYKTVNLNNFYEKQYYYELTDSSKKRLYLFYKSLKNDTLSEMIVTCYYPYNLEKSTNIAQVKAKRVQEYLVELGVSSNIIQAIGECSLEEEELLRLSKRVNIRYR